MTSDSVAGSVPAPLFPVAEQVRQLNDEINAACLARDMQLAYQKLQERRALEALPQIDR